MRDLPKVPAKKLNRSPVPKLALFPSRGLAFGTSGEPLSLSSTKPALLLFPKGDPGRLVAFVELMSLESRCEREPPLALESTDCPNRRRLARRDSVALGFTASVLKLNGVSLHGPRDHLLYTYLAHSCPLVPIFINTICPRFTRHRLLDSPLGLPQLAVARARS